MESDSLGVSYAAKKAPYLLTFINVTLSKSIPCIYHAEIVWRQETVSRPPYGCAIAEGKSTFYF